MKELLAFAMFVIIGFGAFGVGIVLLRWIVGV